MKKIILIILLAGTFAVDYAHGQTIKAYGFKVAYTSADQRFDQWSSDQTERRNGFNAGAFAEWSYLPFLSIVTQIEYAQRGAGIYYALTSDQPQRPDDFLRFTRLDYISVPVVVKLSVPGKGLSPYLICGPRCDFLLGYKDDRLPQFRDYYKFKKVSLGGSAGGGLELNSVLPIGVLLEARYNFDLLDSYSTGSHTARNNSFDVWLGIVF